MNRKGNLYNKVCSMENLLLADALARSNKEYNAGMRQFDQNPVAYLSELRDMLLQKEYSTSKYRTETIFDQKERVISKLPYYPDRIVHYAVMNALAPLLESTFTSDSYASIKGRGLHLAKEKVERAIRTDKQGTLYCLKLDIKQFYPSIDHSILKNLIRRKVKDPDFLWLLDEIIDSAPGLPIGNFTSAHLANYYLTGLDHFIKQKLKVQYYYRYMDDLVLLSGSKKYLHQVLSEIRKYLSDFLHLSIKENYQVFPVDDRGIDFLGYRIFRTHTLLRKRIKQRFARAVKSRKSLNTIAAYYSWAKHCNSSHLLKKLFNVNDQFQGFKHKSESKRLRRRQNINGRNLRQANRNKGFQNRPIKAREVRVPAGFADRF